MKILSCLFIGKFSNFVIETFYNLQRVFNCYHRERCIALSVSMEENGHELQYGHEHGHEDLQTRVSPQ